MSLTKSVAEKKFVVVDAGPRQAKAVEKALRSLLSLECSFVRITDHGEYETFSPFAPDSEKDARFRDAYNNIGDQYDWKVTKKNCSDIVNACDAAIQSTPLRRVDERTTAEQRAERDSQRAADEKRRKEESAVKAAETNKAIASLRAEYPWALARGAKRGSKELSDQARAAANIKEELSRKFPGVSFSVRSDSFAGGDSVDVRWENGPTSKEVDQILAKYTEGSFDGMVDLYEYDSSSYGKAVDEVLGRSKYVHSHREIDSHGFETVCRALCAEYHVQCPDDSSRMYSVSIPDRGESVTTLVHRMAGEMSFPAGARIVGIEAAGDEFREPFKIAFEAPELSQSNSRSAGADTGNESRLFRVEKHFHTKKEFDFWIAVPVKRLGDEQFDRLRKACKSRGGWYSRQWGKTPGGFAFESEQEANAFVSEAG